ncbi:MAG TPA: hypothetical protein ENK19_01420, partial [Acidobacteria bacterium]|nr:hypothetical protein [Acidobacteriota bacterium]
MPDFHSSLRALGIALGVPPVTDAVVRAVLARAASRVGSRPVPERDVGRWLVVVPARGEGEAVEETLASIAAAADGAPLDTVLLLDGADGLAARMGERYGARVVVKDPPGPTKGAALAWLAEHRPELVEAADAILVLDVGSRLGKRFFERAAWPEGAGAVQAWLRGVGGGVGDAVSLSEALAQGVEDRGRQALG